MTNTSNLYRKVRALTAKVVTAGCTPSEHVSATNLAVTIITKHGLDAARIEWPAPPAGFAWSGEPGRSVVVEIPAEPKAGKPKRSRKAKKPTEPKAGRPTKKAMIIAMLRQPGGTTIETLMAEFGMLAHSARAVISVYGREIGGVTYDKATKVYRAATA